MLPEADIRYRIDGEQQPQLTHGICGECYVAMKRSLDEGREGKRVRE